MASETERPPVEELEGRELDAAVAREVMGWSDVVLSCWEDEDGYADCTWHGKPNRGRWPDTYQDVPEYSTDIAAAWEVVEHLHRWASEDRSEPGLAVKVLQYCDPRCRDAPWQAAFYSLDTDDRGWPHEGFSAEADTAPLAIARAALKAVRHTDAPPTSPVPRGAERTPSEG